MRPQLAKESADFLVDGRRLYNHHSIGEVENRPVAGRFVPVTRSHGILDQVRQLPRPFRGRRRPDDLRVGGDVAKHAPYDSLRVPIARAGGLLAEVIHLELRQQAVNLIA